MDDETKCPPDGRLPDASKGPPHIRDIFYRMGFNDQEIVALSGAHALGRWDRPLMCTGHAAHASFPLAEPASCPVVVAHNTAAPQPLQIVGLMDDACIAIAFRVVVVKGSTR